MLSSSVTAGMSKRTLFPLWMNTKTLAWSGMHGRIPSFTTSRHSGREKRNGLHRMGKTFHPGWLYTVRWKNRGLLHGSAPCPHKYIWKKGSPCICNLPGKGFQQQTAVLQHSVPGTVAAVLYMAGKIPTEPDGAAICSLSPWCCMFSDGT